MGKHIVLVEDDRDAQLLTNRSIAGFPSQVNVHVEDDGPGALAHLQTTSHIPDLILMDIKLPKMSGIEVTREIKRIPKYRTVPIVMLTTSSMDRDVLDSYAAGASSYIMKGVDYKAFNKQLHEILNYWLYTNTTLSQNYSTVA